MARRRSHHRSARPTPRKRVAGAAIAVREAVREHAIDPALEDCRKAEPPEWKLEDEGIAPHEFVHF